MTISKPTTGSVFISAFVLLFAGGCLDFGTNPKTPKLNDIMPDTVIAPGESLDVWISVDDTQYVDIYLWDTDGDGNWDDSTAKSRYRLSWPDTGLQVVKAAVRAGDSITAETTVNVLVAASPVDLLRGEEFNEAWRYLKWFFLFQNFLPQNPLEYTTPQNLYAGLQEPYTEYLSKEKADAFRAQLTTRITAAMGIIIDSVAEGYVIKLVVPNSPAQEAGLRKGDVVTKVNDSSVVDVSFGQVRDWVRGSAGDSKRLTVLRNGEEMQITVTLGSFLYPSVYTDTADTHIAYISLMTFADSTSAPGGSSQEFREALEETSWARYTLIDLRGNGGGLLGQCVAIAGEFLPESTAVALFTERQVDLETGEATTARVTHKTGAAGTAQSRKIVFLGDKGTASASELLISAIQSHREAKLVGQTTFGKARGQVLLNARSGGMAKITYAMLTPMQGPSYDLLGIAPDHETETSRKAYDEAIRLAREWMGTPAAKLAAGEPAYPDFEHIRSQLKPALTGEHMIVWK